MMKRLIIFKKKDLKKGLPTIIKIKEELLKKEKELEIKDFCIEDVEFFIKDGNLKILIENEDIRSFDNIFFRVIGKNKMAAFMIAKFCEKFGVEVIDKYHLDNADQEKLTQMFLLALNGLKVPKTYYTPSYEKEKISKMLDYLSLPVVAKIPDLNGGKGVFLLNDEKEVLTFINEKNGQELFFQEFIENEFDYRIVVFDGDVKVAERKIRNKESGDFRNNVGIGATEEFFDVDELDSEIRRISQISAKVMNFQIAGVDVVTDSNGGHYILEVNCAPQFTLDQSVSREIPELINYLVKWLKK